MAWLLEWADCSRSAGTRDGYVAWSAPLGEEEGKRAQAGEAIRAGRVKM